jgi:hypothetical protein
MENDQDYSMKQHGSLNNSQSELFGEEELAEIGSSQSLRMSRACSLAEMVTTLRGASESYTTSGRVKSDGQYWILNTSESRKDASVCSLSQILEANPHPKYSLSPKACQGILRRAEKRGKELPEMLQKALERVAHSAMEAKQAQA